MEDKVGLIVEGGGFKSAFTAGGLDAFLALEFYPFNTLTILLRFSLERFEEDGKHRLFFTNFLAFSIL